LLGGFHESINTELHSFIESLSAKVHPIPPNIDNLSQRFQDFYAQASAHINTHISALASMQSREASPAPSASSISSAASRLRNKATSFSVARERPKAESEQQQQMITAEELAGRKQARRALEVKRHMLEEAVERRLCEGIYDRIYRHKSTQDEADDDKLRSKTAALALVGIGPVDLGIDLGDGAAESTEAAAEKTEEIRKRLEQARKDLVRMHESKYPLGKLNHLKAAHRSIVDTIAHFHPSASADEVMPMLIFTLITLPPEDLHVISDTRFIQYFRWEPKLTGEAAYCITNLEATISFLQTVDLATLRSDELPSGPPKNQPGTPKTETFPPAYPQSMTPTTATTAATETTRAEATATKPMSSSPPGLKSSTNTLRNRRLSDLVNTPAQAFGAASDAVFATADQGLKTVSNSLSDSYKFLLGKLRENQDSPRESIAVPRTLDDARKLVSTPPPEDGGDDEEADLLKRRAAEDRMLGVLGTGRRDRSTDSALSGRSASSSRLNKVLFADEASKASPQQQQQTPAATTTSQTPPVLDQMRSHITSSFNPMARLSNQIGMIRSFGRNVAAQPSAPTSSSTADANKTADGGDLATVRSILTPSRRHKKGPRISSRISQITAH
jgi:hypothetical protein